MWQFAYEGCVYFERELTRPVRLCNIRACCTEHALPQWPTVQCRTIFSLIIGSLLVKFVQPPSQQLLISTYWHVIRVD